MIDMQSELIGERIKLLPMDMSHAAGIFAAGNDPKIWALLPHDPFESVAEVEQWIQQATQSHNEMPFTIMTLDDEIIGSTRYLDIVPQHRMLEIGWTWLSSKYWGSGINFECKYLLLQYAFETLQYNRVQLKTDVRNIRSQKAIEKLGAKREGVLRSSMILPDGYRRDSVYYSILIEEWLETVKDQLLGRFNSKARV